ncbi:hypothetical protein JTB14_023755 [Gonioctena quinquepunctata]|nr:hypothetical protein JTB14_023755 [Gonioctena quinquepunctata]
MVGYCEQSKGYRLADPSHRGKVIKALNVIFVGEALKENTIKDECNMKTVDIPSSANTEDICVMSGMEGIGNGSSVPNIQDGSAATTEEEAVTDLSSWDNISIDDEEIDQFDRPLQNTRGQLPKRLEDFELTFFSDTFINSSNPQSYTEAMSGDYKNEWMHAMKKEYEPLKNNEVWVLVDRPVDHNVVKCKWVYKLKRDASGNFDKFKEVCFVRNLINEINGMQDQIVIYNDNQSAHRIIENTHHHRRTKHIDVRHHYIRDLVQNRVVLIEYRKTIDMVADILTKPLSKEKHQCYRKMMNIESFEDIRVRGSVRSYYTD